MSRLTLFRSADTEQMSVFRTLAALSAARVPLVEALDECLDQPLSSRTHAWLTRTRNRVNAGEPLSKALETEPTIPSLIVALVKTAESTGTLSDAFEKAADFLEMQHERSRSLVSALVYPAVILVVTSAASIFLAAVVMPQIDTMYRQVGRDLPLITQLMRYAVYAVLTLAAVAMLFTIFSRRTPNILKTDRSTTLSKQNPQKAAIFRLEIPILSKLTEAHSTAFWAYSIGTLVSHGVLLPEALELTSQTVAPGSILAREIQSAYHRIIAGEKPGDAFQSIQTLPPLARRLLAGGDAAGNLAEACQRVHRIYDAEYKLWNRRLTAFAEPIAVLIAGVFVILAALAVILPVAELGGLL
ncbi:MAG: type II secretion system F family protein [bacterium]